MRVCYIHIGPHKTGSSSIQQFLRINQEKLFERGLHHPIVESRIERNSRHHDFVLKGGLDERGAILPGATLWQDLDQVVAAGSHDVVLSAEMFSLLFRKPRSLAPIHAYFTRRGYAIEIIAYFRDAPAWVNSWYVQAQKRLFGARSLGEFADVVINRLDPAHALAPYRQDAGFRISPVPFESAVAEGLEVDFVRRCGVTEVDDLVLKPLRNPNAGRKTVYVAQRIMKTHAGNLKHHPNYEKVYRSFKRIWRKHGWDGDPYIGLDDDLCEQIRNRLADSNEQFSQRYFGRPWRDVCPPKSYRRSVFSRSEADEDERQLVDRVIRRLNRELKKS